MQNEQSLAIFEGFIDILEQHSAGLGESKAVIVEFILKLFQWGLLQRESELACDYSDIISKIKHCLRPIKLSAK